MPDNFKNAIIYYFSGTGNAKFAAAQVLNNLEVEGIPTKVINIAEISDNIIDTDEDTLLGFCFPTHGFNAPPIVLKFLRKFRSSRSKVFLINTRAGMKINKFFLPGIGGLALWIPAIILLLKGFKPFAFLPLDMPSNWISLHPGLRKKVVFSIKDRCSNILHEFSYKLALGTPVFTGLFYLPLDILFFPVAILYYVFGRFMLSKTFYANYNCNSCNLCVEQCPVNAIKMVDNRPFWTYKCESCMHCINICPHRAIEINLLYTIGLWSAVFIFIPSLFYYILSKMNIISYQLFSVYSKEINFLIICFFGAIIVFIMYYVVHKLLKINLFNRIFTFFSFTHFWFWRRYYLDKILRKNKSK